jgi:hypothetical protein
MEIVTKTCWALLALVHASPAAALFAPSLIFRLYGVEANGPLGVLLTHRGALFLAVVAVCLFAIFEPSARRAAVVVVGISVIAFLIVYVHAGVPQGALRTVALVDLAALAPLAWVLFSALRHQAA